YREPPPPGLVPSCAEGGVLGVLPGVVGMLQATEVIKLLVGGGDTLTGRLLLYDAWKMKFRELKLEADPECPICGSHPTITKLIDYEQFCGMKTAQDDIPVESISATELKRRFDANEPVQVIDLREPHERSYFKFPNAKAIPLGQIIRRQNELDPSIDTVFVCKIGQRSILAIRNLRAAGYQGRLMNLLDGVQGWKNEVDPTVKLI
ncbi:MAG: adenylyltransferase/sulfurtransferase MoeZ, partial [Victivallales bacterium]|nr:adenylyltransferase/sulfurtransferase MoeZ [Victivallales bacterium]